MDSSQMGSEKRRTACREVEGLAVIRIFCAEAICDVVRLNAAGEHDCHNNVQS